jgi:hypothetical protein
MQFLTSPTPPGKISCFIFFVTMKQLNYLVSIEFEYMEAILPVLPSNGTGLTMNKPRKIVDYECCSKKNCHEHNNICRLFPL